VTTVGALIIRYSPPYLYFVACLEQKLRLSLLAIIEECCQPNNLDMANTRRPCFSVLARQCYYLLVLLMGGGAASTRE
jgi:hypothetical protein